MKRLSLVALSLVLLVAWSASSAAAQKFDPQSLVGEWKGDWTLSGNPSVGGSIWLTIAKVEGGKVSGESQLTGANNVPLSRWVGDLTDRGFTLTTSQWVSVYTVEGDKMTGTTGIGNRVLLSLTKKK